MQTIGPRTANIMIVGKAPGKEEEMYQKPFVGAGGNLLKQMLVSIGIAHHDIMLTNVAKEKPPGNDFTYFFKDGRKQSLPKDFLQAWINELKVEIETFRPNIVVTLGAYATSVLCGTKKIADARGYITESTLVRGQKVLPTFSTSHVLRDWGTRFTVLLDLKKALKNSTSPDIARDKRIFATGLSPNQFIQYSEYLIHEHKEPIAVDIETKRSNQTIEIVGIAESAMKATAISFTDNTGRHKYDVADETALWLSFANIFKHKEAIMQNGKFDMVSLWAKNSVLVEKFIFDTMIAAHVLWPEAPRSLGYLTSICTNNPQWKHTSSSSPLLYNAQDCTNTYEVYNELLPLINADPCHKKTFAHEMAQNQVAGMLEIQGVLTNKVKQLNLVQDAKVDIALLEAELANELGKKVNVKSPKQLSNLLYVDLNLPPQYAKRKSRREAKRVTTDASAMKRLSRLSGNLILDKILKVKKLYKLLSFLEATTSPESRVHTCYNVTGANMAKTKASEAFVADDSGSYKSFGRWSSSKSIILPYGSGNLQNIPKTARKMYTAPKGRVILQCDYKQAEAVVVAYLINDFKLKKLFQDSFGKRNSYCKENGLDVHKVTASMMYGVDIFNVTKEQRNIGKRVRHATNYNMGPKTLADNMGVTLAEGKKLLQQFHDSCPQLKLWHSKIQHQLKKDRTLINLLGRKHVFMGRMDDKLFRSAYAYQPQSTVGDLLNKALVKLYRDYGSQLPILLQLHDASYTTPKKEEVGDAVKAMIECMLMPLTHNEETFTIDVDFSVGDNWGEMEEIEWQDYVT